MILFDEIKTGNLLLTIDGCIYCATYVDRNIGYVYAPYIPMFRLCNENEESFGRRKKEIIKTSEKNSFNLIKDFNDQIKEYFVNLIKIEDNGIIKNKHYTTFGLTKKDNILRTHNDGSGTNLEIIKIIPIICKLKKI